MPMTLKWILFAPHLIYIKFHIVKLPTTRKNTSLDVILTNMNNFYTPPSAMPPLGGSYHLSILLTPSSNFEHSFSITYRLCQNSALLSCVMWLNIEDWSDIYSFKNLDEKMATFHKKLIDKYQIYFPEKKGFKTMFQG